MSNYTKYLEAAITRWYTDFTPDQIFNMWMEEDEENIEDVA